jgi:hypothetical protein
MLVTFFSLLSPRLHPAATAVLVEANVVELTADLIEADEDLPNTGVAPFTVFLAHPDGQQRMCSKWIVERMIRWIAKQLLEVRNIVSAA